MVELAISAITDEFHSDLRKVCEYFSDQDVKYVELRKVLDGNILTIDDNKLGQVKDILNETDTKASCIAGGLLKCVPPSEKPNPGNEKSVGNNWKYNYSLIDRAIEVAKYLDCPYIRCFGYKGKFSVPETSKWSNWQIYKDWTNIFIEMKQKCTKTKKMLVCENEGGLNRSLDHIEKIGKDNCDEAFGMLYDMANVANKYHEEGVLTEQWLNRIAKYFQYVHAKGTRKRFWFIYHTSYINGKGDICRWPQVVKHMRDMKAKDFVSPAPNPLFLSIETHFGSRPRWKYSVQNLKNLKELLEN